MMRPSEGGGDAADSASATHAALLSALERMTAQEEAVAAARRAALTAAAYDTEAEGGSPVGLASPWQLLSREASADDLLADVAGAQRGRVAAQHAERAEAATQAEYAPVRVQSEYEAQEEAAETAAGVEASETATTEAQPAAPSPAGVPAPASPSPGSAAPLTRAEWLSAYVAAASYGGPAVDNGAHSETPALVDESDSEGGASGLASDADSDDETLPPLSSAAAASVVGAAADAAAHSEPPSLVSSVALSSISALAYSDSDDESVPEFISVDGAAVVVAGGAHPAEPAALPAPLFARAPFFDAYLKTALPPPPASWAAAAEPGGDVTASASYDIGGEDYWHPGTLAAGAVLLGARLGAMAAAKAARSAKSLWLHASDAADAAPACARACARAAAHVASDPKLSIAAVVLLGGPLAAVGAMEAAGLRSRVARAEADIAALRSEVGAVQAAMQAQRAPLASHGFRTSWRSIPIN